MNELLYNLSEGGRMNGSLAVKTRDLSKHYDGLKAVDNLNLEIQEGISYGLVGPNGAGKTTTIKMLTGSIEPTSGTAEVLGETLGSKHLARKIGYMPQEFALYEGLTVDENLDLFGGLFDLEQERLKDRKREVLEFVGLEERRDSLVNNLSGGMKKRLSLATALFQEPQILFLDEPTVGVDPELKASFWENFKRLEEEGKTIVITTHYLAEASRCSRVGMMYEGDLIEEGTPRKSWRRRALQIWRMPFSRSLGGFREERERTILR